MNFRSKPQIKQTKKYEKINIWHFRMVFSRNIPQWIMLTMRQHRANAKWMSHQIAKKALIFPNCNPQNCKFKVFKITLMYLHQIPKCHSNLACAAQRKKNISQCGKNLLWNRSRNFQTSTTISRNYYSFISYSLQSTVDERPNLGYRSEKVKDFVSSDWIRTPTTRWGELSSLSSTTEL